MNAVMKPDSHRAAATRGLTEMQATFVKHYSNGLNQTKAAELAGYSNPPTDAWRLLQTQSIIDAISRQMQTRLMTEGQQVALAFMLKAPGDEKLPGAVRFQAAKWLAESAGHGLAAQRAALGLPADDKPLSEMSITELDAFLAAGRGAIAQIKANEMRTIDGNARNVTSDGVAADVQVIEHKGDHDK